MRDAINRAVKQDATTQPHSVSQNSQRAIDSDCWDTSGLSYPFDAVSRLSLSPTTLALLGPSLSFLRWLTQFLLDCQYPAAAYERHCAALEILRLMVACFNLQHERQQPNASDNDNHGDLRTESINSSSAALDSHLIRHAVLSPLLTASSVLILLAGVGRAWQSVRLSSYSLLIAAFPAPLPGFTTCTSVRRLLEWSLSLSASPRARDSEAGALAIKLVFIKYVQQMCWTVPLQHIAHSAVEQQQQQQRAPRTGPLDDSVADLAADRVPSEWPIASSSASAVFSFLRSIRSLLTSQLSKLRSMPLSSRYTAAHSRLHGVVRLFRLVIEEVDYSGWNETAEWRSDWAALVSDMLRLLSDIALVSLKLHVPKQAHRLMQAAFAAEKQAMPGNTAELIHGLQPSDDMQPARAVQSVPDSGREGEEERQEQVGYGAEAVDGDEDEADIESVDCRGHFVLSHSQPNGSSAHLIVVSSWLTIKEVCLLLGAWINTCPLALSEAEAEAKAAGEDSSLCGSSRVSLLSVSDVQRVGGVFLSVLGHSKHNGVLENAHVGLLQVCERLLSSDDTAYRVVNGWLEELMRRISSVDDDSWLRRSRGIAFALLAILKAQPSHRPPLLLSRAMECVVEQANKAASTSADNLEQWRSAVHGLNLLRSLFRDSSLHVGCLPYVTAALEASVGGFSHPVWAVRNSALISFAPIALKAIRAQYNQQMKQHSGMTASELFALYPELQPFLLRHLARASATVDAVTQIHPTLYPLLMIFSRLRAGHNAASEQRATDVRPFAEALHSLASHPHYQARRMAARALLALTDTEKQQTDMDEIALLLPDTVAVQRPHHNGWNGIEGRLLQLTALFEAWCSRPHSSSDGWLASFVGQLSACEWLGSTVVPAPAIRIAYLSLLTSALLALPESHSLRSLPRMRVCLSSLAACCSPPIPSSFAGFGCSAMRSQAASLLLRVLLSVTEPVDATSVCLSLLSDRDVGVRRAVMQTVLFVLATDRVDARLSIASVHSSVCSSLTELSHPPHAHGRVASVERFERAVVVCGG